VHIEYLSCILIYARYHEIFKRAQHAETMHYSASANTSDSFYEFIVFAKRTEICCRLILNSLPCRLFAKKKLWPPAVTQSREPAMAKGKNACRVDPCRMYYRYSAHFALTSICSFTSMFPIRTDNKYLKRVLKYGAAVLKGSLSVVKVVLVLVN